MFSILETVQRHQADVKSVSSFGDGIISGSRDKSVIIWEKQGPKQSLIPSKTIIHPNFINAVNFIPPTKQFPNGLIASGGIEAIVYLHSPNDVQNPIKKLVGHSANITNISFSFEIEKFLDDETYVKIKDHVSEESFLIISCSWDETVRIWFNDECIYTLECKSAVWSAIVLNNGDIITGSADKKLRQWRKGKLLKVVTDQNEIPLTNEEKNEDNQFAHRGCIRCLCILPEIGFASAANDKIIKIWNFEGNLLHKLEGHESFIYSLVYLPTGELISAGEDRSVKVWKPDGKSIQTIIHPATSVWGLTILSNGDFVTCSSDGAIRIFTKSKELIPEVIEEFNQSNANFKISKHQIDDFSLEKLPSIEALQTKGEVGQTIYIRDSNNIEAYYFNDESKWQKIGFVFDAIESTPKTEFEGKLYDYVFNVDVGDDSPLKKLPYNLSENPQEVAKAWVEKEQLSVNYIENITNFILTNTNQSL